MPLRFNLKLKMPKISQLSVFLYVPNLIGYLRVILAIAAFAYLPQPVLFLPLYAISCLLDALDGHAARLLNQCSKFGAVLDMVTDRSTTAGLTAYLAHIYPQHMVIFLVLIGLDLSSHYMHMYSSLLSGSQSHKAVRKDVNFILYYYYTSRTVLFWVCAFNELFYIVLYCWYHQVLVDVTITAGRSVNITFILLIVSAPIWAFKQFVNVIQMIGASKQLASLDSKKSH